MSCQPPIRTVTVARRIVCFSLGGAAPAASALHVLSPDELVQIAPTLAGLRVTITVENATAQCETKAAFEATNDGCTWETAIDLEVAAQGNRTNTTVWHTTTANFKRGIRVGVIVEQASGTNIESCKVTMTIDFELRS